MIRVSDWIALRGALLAFGVATLAGAGVVQRISALAADSEAAYNARRAELHTLRQDYRLAQTDRATYRRYLPRYRVLQGQGVIGGKPRLDWVEALQQLNRALRLPVLRYEIEPRQRLTSGLHKGHPEAFRASMKIEAGLLHEGDLLTLIAELRRLTGDRFEVTSCHLQTRYAERPAFDLRTPNVWAVCRIDWYTVGAPAAPRAGS